jgi:ribosomal protein L37AE/L43A
MGALNNNKSLYCPKCVSVQLHIRGTDGYYKCIKCGNKVGDSGGNVRPPRVIWKQSIGKNT